MPTPIDELLAEAAFLPGAVTAADLAASRRRIERALDDTALTVPYDAARRFESDEERSGRELLALCGSLVRDARAPAWMAGLVNSERIEPAGGLVFACLLHLSGLTDGARFWWEFSAGAGTSTAALCLCLLHLQRGEPEDAEHWAGQAAELEPLEREHEWTARPRVWWPRGALAEALESLDIGRDQDLGMVPRPDPALAGRLEDCVAVS
ncbi:hypothetical protein [Streptomyces avicenniae]|uniref:hypothetical protein n=1 Tax=Streptomyces avicenniae TaxID=500153 RepID=UPI000AE6183E|nr:hypothetical protein [Streptomyces avicenniae]